MRIPVILAAVLVVALAGVLPASADRNMAPVAVKVLATPTPEDCISYNPAGLAIVSRGPSGWQLTDGPRNIQWFQTQGEALRGLAVVRRHTQHCFIGRNNTMSGRQLYTMDYWK